MAAIRCTTPASKPYEDYFVTEPIYDSYNRRRGIYIIHKETRVRTHLPYAKYLLEVHLERKLLKTEHAHHKDGNPLNDAIENLEPLSLKDHYTLHNQIHKARKFVCECGVEFELTATQVGQRIRNARSIGKELSGPYCSRSCVSKYGRANAG